MKLPRARTAGALLALVVFCAAWGLLYAQERGQTSYAPVDIKERFAVILSRMRTEKPAIEKRQADLLAERYDLSNHAAPGVTMTPATSRRPGPRPSPPRPPRARRRRP